jgi:hypothetical protein
MTKGCEFLIEEESMDGTEYTCEHPVYSNDTCDRCRLGPIRREVAHGNIAKGSTKIPEGVEAID